MERHLQRFAHLGTKHKHIAWVPFHLFLFYSGDSASIVSKSFAGTDDAIPSAHGTAIASLLLGRGSIKGVVTNAALYVADVFGGMPTGGAADAVIQGLAWMAEKRVPVINISLVGPSNKMLETVIHLLLARGHVIVAAVGNSGPASPVEYPAAYDGVIAVTSVDAKGQIQIDANQGRQVAFAALGVDLPVAGPKKTYARATGTSFAAPLVAARFALVLASPDAQAATQIFQQLQHEAVDLGVPGRDSVFGYGFLECPPGSKTLSLNQQ